MGRKKKVRKTAYIGILVFLVILVVVNGYLFFFTAGAGVFEEYQAVILFDPKCEVCKPVAAVASLIDAYQLPITSEQIVSIPYSSIRGKKIVEEYNIEHVPAVLVYKKAMQDRFIGDFEKRKDAFLLKTVSPPLKKLDGSIVGLVTVTMLTDATCTACVSEKDAVDILSSFGLVIDKRIVVDSASEDGQALIKAYNIDRVPTILLSADTGAYPIVTRIWEKSGGTIEPDGIYILRDTPPPYRNLSSGTMTGVVDVTFLVDKSCTQCHDVDIHRKALEAAEVVIGKETILDINDIEGKSIMELYNIRYVPTYLLSKDAEVYDGLTGFWDNLGTIEKDGTYVFRELHVVQNIYYKDLSTGKLVWSAEAAR